MLDALSEDKANILLVDDRQENLVALESVLIDLGHNLVKATSGEEALRHLLRHDAREFAVILLDVQMPGMDGFETAELIRARARTQHTPIVFLTAINKTDRHVTRGYSVGGVDYVFKPYEPEVLKAKVTAFVELWRKTRELEDEVERRSDAEEEVRRLNEDLEQRVAERTRELEDANRELQQEIVERRKAEEERERSLALEQQARAAAERAQRRIAFLGEASAILAASLDYDTTLERVARLPVPYLADFCLVDVTWDDGRVERLATAHVDPARSERLQGLCTPPIDPDALPLSPAPVLLSSRTEPIGAGTFANPGGTEEHAEILRGCDPRAGIAVPLVTHGYTLGVMTLLSAESGRTYGPEEIALAEDLARRAAAAIDNARLYREVQESGRHKDEFLAMLSHELRNPLAAISNAEYALRTVKHGSERATKLRDVMGRQIKQLTRMVDDLLDVSRINEGKIELRMEPVELSGVVQRALEATQPLIDSRKHRLEVSLPPDTVCVQADAARLEQVIANLVNNAAKYTDPGGHIWVTLEREAPSRTGNGNGTDAEPRPHVLVRVRDTGMGIPRELLPRIFDLFAQADRTLDRSQGGLGIGLALVHQMVVMHGGTVTAQSEGPGKGSEFVVRLPLLQHVQPRDRTAPVTDKTGRCLNVLVVEDNRDAAETLEDLLEDWGHQVCLAGDGTAALERVQDCHPEVILLDIGLPGMDGFEVARRMRREAGLDRSLLVAMTGYGNNDHRERAVESGFDMHLTKPVDPEELRRLLASVSHEDLTS